MSERAEQLADRVVQEISRMITFVDGLTKSQLDAACRDPKGATVRHVLDHLCEGTDQVVAWAATLSAGTPAGDAAVNNEQQHGHHHEHASVAEVPQTIEQLHHLKTVLLATISGLTDQQLDFVPPPSPGLTDGATPLHGIVAFIADDVAGHLRHLTDAVASYASHV